jgi:glycosyltransferase involved in cell wall biosynthesis
VRELISVIIPVHNVEPYLPRCLESIIHQEYENIQIIVVNDGSTDGSKKVCDDYASQDHRIKVIHQDYNGVADARNKGLYSSSGKYIIFLDGDDEAETNYISKLYHTLIENDLDIALCCLIRVKNGIRNNELAVLPGIKIFSGIEMQPKIFDRDRYFSMCLCGKLFIKELFDGLRFPVGRINEDESLIYRLYYRAKRVGVIDDYLYLYHYNKESITEKKYGINRLDCFYMLEEKFAFYKSAGMKNMSDKTANEYFSQISAVLSYKKNQIEDYCTTKKLAKAIYKKDRKDILSKSLLKFDKKVFYLLSYLSTDFVMIYGKLLKYYLARKKLGERIE